MEENQNNSLPDSQAEPQPVASQSAPPVQAVPPSPPVHSATYTVVAAQHGKEKTGFTVWHEATLGELLNSFLLLALLSTYLLRWMYKVVWRR